MLLYYVVLLLLLLLLILSTHYYIRVASPIKYRGPTWTDINDTISIRVRHYTATALIIFICLRKLSEPSSPLTVSLNFHPMPNTVCLSIFRSPPSPYRRVPNGVGRPASNPSIFQSSGASPTLHTQYYTALAEKLYLL